MTRTSRSVLSAQPQRYVLDADQVLATVIDGYPAGGGTPTLGGTSEPDWGAVAQPAPNFRLLPTSLPT